MNLRSINLQKCIVLLFVQSFLCISFLVLLIMLQKHACTIIFSTHIKYVAAVLSMSSDSVRRF